MHEHTDDVLDQSVIMVNLGSLVKCHEINLKKITNVHMFNFLG